MRWYEMRCTEMSLDPVIAVIVVSRDPATHVNYLYQALVGFILVSVGSTSSILERAVLSHANEFTFIVQTNI